ncbi:SDR family oxidoreductase [Arcicella lustrica]|uniref:SDR family oxidoreductase n=1 Tax=Arcicella lustrica TaxID=2984196 RepID=A0ABU5SLK0_9BACT|nr:SDR family oxidoreductase [Arcicella sp. DC25W]MEA5428167.1 SDR family oxidoreductase [Arcicella sp. DC25W]
MNFNEPMLRDGALRGKTIIVTGGGTGLGRSMSKYFLELGANVVIASRKKAVLDETAAELIAETGGKVLAIACDARNYDEVENVLKSSVEHFGAVHGLVNNAAGNFISPTEKLSHKAFDIVVDIVLKGSYNFSLAVGKYWIEQKIKGTVMSIVTTYAWTGSAYVVPSATAKAGVLALTRSLAVEWGAKYGIRFNAIAPGPFPTQGAWERLFPAEAMGEELANKLAPENRIPLKRVGEHHELANLAAYLMSEFSAYINGEVITIDGGEWLMGAGEFSDLNEVSEEKWEAIAKAVRGKK